VFENLEVYFVVLFYFIDQVVCLWCEVGFQEWNLNL